MSFTKSDQPLSWSDRLLLGYGPLDDTHREFVEVVANLQAAADNELPGRLEAVLEHLERHFGEEEAWMRETSFPATDCHVSEHAAVCASGHDVKKALANGDVALCRRYAEELANWFPGHADYLDAPLAHWLSKKRFGAVPIVIRRGIVQAKT